MSIRHVALGAVLGISGAAILRAGAFGLFGAFSVAGAIVTSAVITLGIMALANELTQNNNQPNQANQAAANNGPNVVVIAPWYNPWPRIRTYNFGNPFRPLVGFLGHLATPVRHFHSTAFRPATGRGIPPGGHMQQATGIQGTGFHQGAPQSTTHARTFVPHAASQTRAPYVSNASGGRNTMHTGSRFVPRN